MIRDILKMGDERLLRLAPPVPAHLFGSAELEQLIADMFETMAHVGGVGLAAPQIGVDLQLVIFGFERSERYPDAVRPGYHMNKKHWNTVLLDGSINRSLVMELIDHSYDLVYASLPKKLRNELEN